MMASSTFNNIGMTLTFGECVENHVGNQQIGALAESGFSSKDLEQFYEHLTQQGMNCELVDLSKSIGDIDHMDAKVLVIRNGVGSIGCNSDHLFEEISSIEHDKKMYAYGKVMNKNARHNLCFSDFDQEPCYEEKKGRVVDFKHLPCLSMVREHLPQWFGEKAKKLGGESNLYYDLDKCFIGPHGDKERKIVIGVRLGDEFPLAFHWYHKGVPIGERVVLNLKHGDIYIMDDKASGFDWKKRIIPTLRHAACEKGIKMFVTKKKK